MPVVPAVSVAQNVTLEHHAAFLCTTTSFDQLPTTESQALPHLLTTELDPEVHFPWLQTFELGLGIDALTGRSKSSPFKGVRNLPVSRETDLRSDLEIRIVHGQHERRSQRTFQGRGTVNPVIPVSLSGSFNVEKTRKGSNSSFMIEHNASGEYNFESLNMDDLELTPEAQALLRTPHEFRERYGDYFVVGFQRRYTFNTLVECLTSGTEDTNKFEASAEIAWRDLIGVSGGLSFNKGSSQVQFGAAAFVSHSGCNFQISPSTAVGEGLFSVTLNDVVEMGRSIQNKPPDGRKEIALLKHYSELFRSLSKTIPVAPGVFDTLHKMAATAWDLERYKLHPACSWALARQIDDATTQFREQRASLITDSVALDRARLALATVRLNVDDRLLRHQFMEDVSEASRANPAVNDKVMASRPNQKWVYGFVTAEETQSKAGEGPTLVKLTNNIEAFEIVLEVATGHIAATRTLEFHCQRARLTLGSTYRPAEVNIDGLSACIVGWTLSCRTRVSMQKGFSITDGGIGKEDLVIEVGAFSRSRALLFGGALWRCRVYFVDTKDYDFPWY